MIKKLTVQRKDLPKAKLTKEDVIRIRYEYENGFLISYSIAIGMPTFLGVFITKKLWNLQHSNRKILRIIATALLKIYSNEGI